MNEVLVNHYRCPASLIPLALSEKLSFPGLPSQVSQAIDDLRHERYPAAHHASVLASSVFQKAYYALRPFLGIPLRKHLQRFFLRGWKSAAFPLWPLDTTVERLMEKLLLSALRQGGLDRIPLIWFWPEGAPGCVTLTHDVETRAGVKFTPRLMDFDEQFGIAASFQVIPEKQYPVSREFRDEISRRGFEVNVQDLTHDGNLYSSREEFLARARAINRYLQEWGAHGFRAGRMYRNLDWYDALDISYDMSVPNTAALDPQHGGCCTVFPYFLGRILELPLTTIQDYTLFHILGEYSPDLWKAQTALILEEHGLASFLVHPDYIREPRALEVYTGLLDYLSALRDEEGVWIALPGEVNRWWRQRNQMTLVQDGGEWRIEGAGHERARIAWARIENDAIVYTVERDSAVPSCRP